MKLLSVLCVLAAVCSVYAVRPLESLQREIELSPATGGHVVTDRDARGAYYHRIRMAVEWLPVEDSLLEEEENLSADEVVGKKGKKAQKKSKKGKKASKNNGQSNKKTKKQKKAKQQKKKQSKKKDKKKGTEKKDKCWTKKKMPGKWCTDKVKLSASEMKALKFEADAKYAAPWTGKHPVSTAWKSASLVKHIEGKLKAAVVPGTKGQVKVRDALQHLADHGCKVFIHGGGPRDFITNTDAKDIDMAVTCDVIKDVKQDLCVNHKVWKKHFGDNGCSASPIKGGKYMLLKVGFDTQGDDYDRLDVMPFEADFHEDLSITENTANILSYDIKNQVILDPTGEGFDDICHGVLRIPVKKEKWNDWLEKGENPKKIPRYFKMFQKGYSADCVPGQNQFVVDHLIKDQALYQKVWGHPEDLPPDRKTPKPWKPYGGFAMEGSDSFNHANLQVFWCKDLAGGKWRCGKGLNQCYFQCKHTKDGHEPLANIKKANGVFEAMVKKLKQHGKAKAKKLVKYLENVMKFGYRCKGLGFSCGDFAGKKIAMAKRPPHCRASKELTEAFTNKGDVCPTARPDYWKDIFSWDKEECNADKVLKQQYKKNKWCVKILSKKFCRTLDDASPTGSVYALVQLNKLRFTQATIGGQTADGNGVDSIIKHMAKKGQTVCGEKLEVDFKPPNEIMSDEYIQTAELVLLNKAKGITSVDNRRMYSVISAAWKLHCEANDCKGQKADQDSTEWWKKLDDKYKILARVHHKDENLPLGMVGRFKKKLRYKSDPETCLPKVDDDDIAKTWGQAAEFRCKQQSAKELGEDTVNLMKLKGKSAWKGEDLEYGSRQLPFMKDPKSKEEAARKELKGRLKACCCGTADMLEAAQQDYRVETCKSHIKHISPAMANEDNLDVWPLCLKKCKEELGSAWEKVCKGEKMPQTDMELPKREDDGKGKKGKKKKSDKKGTKKKSDKKGKNKSDTKGKKSKSKSKPKKAKKGKKKEGPTQKKAEKIMDKKGKKGKKGKKKGKKKKTKFFL